MAKQNDLSRCLVTLEQDATVIAVIEIGQSSWLVAGIVPGLERNPLKKLSPDPDALLQLLHRWRKETMQAGCTIKRIAVAYEAGRDGFWLARWLRARDIEAYVIHPSSVPVSREHRRAKTDRLDTELLKRAFLGWLRGEPKHCSMAAIPTLADEDAKRPGRERQSLVGERTRIINRLKANLARLGIRDFRPNLAHASNRLEALRTPEDAAVPANTLAELRRDMDRLRFVKQQIKEIETTRAKRLAGAPNEQRHATVRLLARVVGVGIETADMLVQEVFSRNIRDRKALARYAGLTGAPDESGKKRRERGLAKAGNARVRRGMIELAWGHLVHQKASALTAWYRKRTSDARSGTRKTMIVALARKLLIALWRLVTTGETPAGLLLRPAASTIELLRPSNIQCRAAADGPRWRQPNVGLWSLHRGLERARLLGASPPMRMTASWLRSSRIGRIQVRGARSARTMASSPSVSSQLRTGVRPDRASLPLCSRPSRASRSAMAFGHP